jgi:sugar lactone lactonase YvrE
VLRVVFALFLLLAVGLVLLPSPVKPEAWSPPPAPPLVGPLAPNEVLRDAALLAEGAVRGPEDLAFDAVGRVYAATADGKVVRLGANGAVEDYAATGGRPLGLRFDAGGSLVVCDLVKGLLAIDPARRVTVLATEADGVPFAFINNVDIASDGAIYFSDATSKFRGQDYRFDLLEARPHGRLLRYDPSARKTSVVLPDLYFANGVALSRNEDFLVVSETYRYRLRRYWLKGPKAGTSDVLADDLPGFPDNVDGNRHGSFWVAMFTVRNAVADALHPRPWAKSMLAKLPLAWWPKAEQYGLVLEVGEDGRILRSFHDPGGRRVHQITTARESSGQLYLGTLEQSWIGRLALPPR